MKFSNLMTLAEASTGYVGGPAVDRMPHLSLTECIGQFPVAMLESQMESLDETAAQNEALVEAAVTGGDMTALVEGVFESLKTKIKAIFDKIVKWLKSIVSKLTLQIDKIFMTGKQLWSKYKDRPELKKNFRGLEIEGYKFPGGNNALPKASSFDDNNSIMNLQAKAVGENEYNVLTANQRAIITDFYANRDNEGGITSIIEGYQNNIDAIKDVDNATRIYNMVKVLTGMSDLDESTWESDIKEAIYGDKEKLEAGTDFTKESIGSLLENPVNLEKIKKEYEHLTSTVEKVRKQYEKEMADAESKLNKNHKDDEGDRRTNQSKLMSMFATITSTKVDIFKDAVGAIGKVKDIHFNYEKARIDQAKVFLGKMLSYKEKKDDNDASGADIFADFEI